ncbi:DNA repair exonuclease SbcCD nuclease subunit [Natronoarchaeum philippinense]|uniref:DNA double-strand break repair protein Mre11 n=1 Tax=Natronoarchaeum philippinense TaxID=558529 RepID=A0A285NTR7_NATPI|nr:DNA repair exonuclease [Natronoarchaeum philippinense]SNZ12323.1 DNA repair exonuclease SbcCD nuclease subunit [Natronoarchaeum philippinense]
MTTRLLHVSDTHLGNRQYGSDTRREDFADAFEQAIEYAIDQDVDAVIHTGDLFDTRDPRLPDLNRCIDILQSLDAADIPFYGIVGNHERKMDDQYLDLIRKTGAAERLDTSPTLINDEVAIYGIDAVTRPAWHAEDFTLDSPPEDVFTILCMHQLLQPPVPEIQAEHPLEDVLDRLNLDLDALALGDYHESVGTVERGTTVWYAGSTERCAVDEDASRSVSLLEIENGELTRRQKELDTRDFETITINFTEDDSYGHAEDEIDRHVVEKKVVLVTVVGESNSVTSSDVRGIVMDRGAAVCCVDDERGGPEIDTSDGPSGDVQNKDRRIEEKLAEKDLSDIAAQIDERVRTEGVAPSGFDDEVEEMVMDAQAEAFDEAAEATPTEVTDE